MYNLKFLLFTVGYKILKIINRALLNRKYFKSRFIPGKNIMPWTPLEDEWHRYQVEWENNCEIQSFSWVPFSWVEKYPALLTQFKDEKNL